jgi:hypothetical protein
MQLRWEEAPENDGGWDWQCLYELVLPLRPGDIRREKFDDDGNVIERQSELVVSMGPPLMRGSTERPTFSALGERYADTPYRNGAHALWDSAHLGDLPIFVIGPDGRVFPVEKPAKIFRG